MTAQELVDQSPEGAVNAINDVVSIISGFIAGKQSFEAAHGALQKVSAAFAEVGLDIEQVP